MFPSVVTHIFDPLRGAARNICNLPRDQAQRILDEIGKKSGRAIKADYLERRFRVEDWLIGERRNKLGETPLTRPVYFFLGDFADGRDLSRPASLVMPLSAFRAETITFTYPDSMASLPIATMEKHRSHRKPYHGRVFTLDEMKAVVAEFGLPQDRWRHDPTMAYDRFIEVQVWDDEPIKNSKLGNKAKATARSAEGSNKP